MCQCSIFKFYHLTRIFSSNDTSFSLFEDRFLRAFSSYSVTLFDYIIMAELSDEAIVGSAIIKIIETYGKDAPEHVRQYVQSIDDAFRQCDQKTRK